METEAEAYLTKVRQVRNVGDARGRLVQKAVRYLTSKERKTRQDEKKWLGDVLSQPAWVLKELSGDRRGRMKKRLQDIEDDLNETSPPTDLKGETKDALVMRLKELDQEIVEGMPTHEVMRRNPPGAIGMHSRWHKAKAALILERKNILRLLDPERDGEDPDYASVEMLRPSGLSPDGAATFMMNAQIPGHFAMSPLAKANWPAGMPPQGTVDTPLKQAERQEVVAAMVEEGVIKPNEIEEMKAVLKQLQESNAELKATLETKSKREGEIKANRIAAMAKARSARKPKKESVVRG